MAFFESLLYKSVANGDIKELVDFLDRGLSPDYAFTDTEHRASLGKTLLEVAVLKAQYGIVQILLMRKCDPNLTNVVDVENYSLKIRPYLKSNRLKQTAIFPCIVRGEIDMVELLVKGGQDVNLTDDRGCTALWHAVDLKHYAMAKAFVRAPGCDVNAPDVTRLCPLHVAAIHSDVKIASLLIRHGAKIDVLTVRGSTPLIIACKKGSYDTSRLLLLNGANPNHKGINGHTPISAVLEACSDRQILDMLIEAGACIDHADIRKCLKEKLPLLKTCSDVLETLKVLASNPRHLKILCCLVIRKSLLVSKSNIHLVLKVQQLPLPNIVKEFLLLNYL
ncbi:ankyrin repeat [Plakobranchus ocellatus]|uniref:Ankyrin repeat n=1 Tax=Plakobranchus ocellatus TaxID=259542 RepID=A0AAV4DD19_9GAST|nr:ankyrin repeat [Plakobranchus ocellatus]